jgi:hypothetical protein
MCVGVYFCFFFPSLYLYTRIMNWRCWSVCLDLVGRIQVIPKIQDHQDERNTIAFKVKRQGKRKLCSQNLDLHIIMLKWMTPLVFFKVKCEGYLSIIRLGSRGGWEVRTPLEFVEHQNKQCKVTKKLPMTPPSPAGNMWITIIEFNSIWFIDSLNMMPSRDGIQSYITKWGI